MTRRNRFNRRDILKGGLIAGTGLAAPTLMTQSAFGTDAKKLVFISEESSPAAQAAYKEINADFKVETGITVAMEYPGYDKISQRVATLIAVGAPAELVWYGAGSALQVALQDQFESVDDLVDDLKIPVNQRLVVNGKNRSVPTSQQFVYGWYRSDLYSAAGVEPYTDWASYLSAVEKLNDVPKSYGTLIPSAQTGASHLLMQNMMQTNDAHWFKYDEEKGDYVVSLDAPGNIEKVVETLDFLNQAHKFSPEASNYSWGDLMSQYFTGRVATSYYVGSRLLQKTMTNAPDIAPSTKPIPMPTNASDNHYLSVQGFHVGVGSNVDGAKSYIKFFLNHPGYIKWLHSVPMHIIPSKRETLLSEKYQDNDVIQKRMDVLKFIDSIWEKGKPSYLWDGSKINPYVGLYESDNLGGWMLAERNIRGRDAKSVIQEAAEKVRQKQADLLARK